MKIPKDVFHQKKRKESKDKPRDERKEKKRPKVDYLPPPQRYARLEFFILLHKNFLHSDEAPRKRQFDEDGNVRSITKLSSRALPKLQKSKPDVKIIGKSFFRFSEKNKIEK